MTEQKGELPNKEGNFMESLIGFIESLAHSTDATESVDAEKSVPRSDEDWAEESQKLVSLYKYIPDVQILRRIELLTLQNKYRDMVRELCTQHLSKNLPVIYAYLTTANAHEKPIGNQQDDVIKGIRARTVFNSIAYDLESVVTQDVNLHDFEKGDKELVLQLLDKVRDYKEHVLEQLDETYEDVKFRLESYYRNMVKQVKDRLATNIENEGEASPATELTKITSEHQAMLLATREQYEAKMTRIEQDHQQILQKLMKSHALLEPSLSEANGTKLVQREGNVTSSAKGTLASEKTRPAASGRKAGENVRPAAAATAY